MGLFNLFGKSETDPDGQVLIQLKKAGSNLSEPHEIEFFLYFPSEQAANQAAAKIKTKGFNVDVSLSAEGSDWLCYTTKKMIPDLQNFQNIRTYFNKLADSFGGEYDGWGTEIVN